MSLLTSANLRINKPLFKKRHLRTYTQSTGIETQRTQKTPGTLNTQRTLKAEDNIQRPNSRTLPFTIKKQLFSKCHTQSINQAYAQVKKSSNSIKQKMYHSLQPKSCTDKKYQNFFTQTKSQYQQNKSQRVKTQIASQKLTKKIIFPIQNKSSSDKNKFSNTSIKAYSIATCKGQRNVQNNHLVLLNLGLIKQFYLIQCLDGSQCGSFIKKNISFVLLKQYLNQVQWSKNMKDNLSCLQTAIIKSFNYLKKQISKMQKEKHDNSGCFISAILVLQSNVLAINCGLGTCITFTKSGKIMKVSQPHSTSNQKQVKRIISSGSQIYQAEFNVKYKQKLSVKGPIRLYPSGHMYTRVIGKTFDKIQQNKVFYKNTLNPQYIKNQISLLSDPQITFISTKDIQFMIIASSSLEQFMQMSLICSIMVHQINKYGSSFNIHDLAGQCSKQILNQAYLRGYNQTSSVVVVLFGLQVQKLNGKDQGYKLNQNSGQWQATFKYAGNRRSFCKQQKA